MPFPLFDVRGTIPVQNGVNHHILRLNTGLNARFANAYLICAWLSLFGRQFGKHTIDEVWRCIGATMRTEWRILGERPITACMSEKWTNWSCTAALNSLHSWMLSFCMASHGKTSRNGRLGWGMLSSGLCSLGAQFWWIRITACWKNGRMECTGTHKRTTFPDFAMTTYHVYYTPWPLPQNASKCPAFAHDTEINFQLLEFPSKFHLDQLAVMAWSQRQTKALLWSMSCIHIYRYTHKYMIHNIQ
jgi:hypothetical protein